MLLSQKDAGNLLRKYRISYLPTTRIDQPNLSKLRIRYPAVLKVDSKEVIHKSDLGLVFANISDFPELGRKIKTAETILKMHDIKEYDLVVQSMVKGTELILGMKRDLAFGPVMIFGLGGVFVEIMKDVSMRVLPASKKDCIAMINEIKGSKLLKGYRGNLPADERLLVEMMLGLSKLSMNEKKIEEIDFNPVMINDKDCIVVDARILVNEHA